MIEVIHNIDGKIKFNATCDDLGTAARKKLKVDPSPANNRYHMLSSLSIVLAAGANAERSIQVIRLVRLRLSGFAPQQ